MKAIQYKNKTYTIPKPFDQCNFGANPTHELTIMNRFSDENYTCLLYTSDAADE